MCWDSHKCKCGQLYFIYVPKKLILEEAGGFGSETIRAAGEIDERERKSGEIEVIKKSVKKIGAKFIDVRVNRVLRCKCGETFDPLSFLSKPNEETTGA